VPVVLFDTDPGVDDALALLFLHLQPTVELAGITTVAGNGTIEAVTRNALYLADRFAIEAPIAQGAGRPLQGELRLPPAAIHGENALGGVQISAARRALDPRPAHRFIIESVRERPGVLTLLAVGMLTNIARAIIDDPGIVPLVRNVVVMGGAFGGGGRYGNRSPAGEANIYGDPHAADIVCTARWPLTLVGLDVTEQIVMTSAYLATLRDRGADAGRFVWDVTRGYEAFHTRRSGLTGIFAHDPSAAVCAVDDSAFTFRSGSIRVATAGITAGMTVQKPDGRAFPPSPWDDAPSGRVAVDVDAQRVLELYAAPFIRA
jgi:inosine-uridine nucleoside N-ribohydrolase